MGVPSDGDYLSGNNSETGVQEKGVAAGDDDETSGKGSTSCDSSYSDGLKSRPIVDTGQVTCYDDVGYEIPCPSAGALYYGQDAHHAGNEPRYTNNGDGAVSDSVTGLMWQQSPDTGTDGRIDAGDKQTYDEAVSGAASLTLGGYSDWRLPAIKELYYLIDFSGMDPSGYTGTDTSGLVPFMDATVFDFAYGDGNADEYIIDAQYAGSTLYVSNASPLEMLARVDSAGRQDAAESSPWYLKSSPPDSPAWDTGPSAGHPGSIRPTFDPARRSFAANDSRNDRPENRQTYCQSRSFPPTDFLHSRPLLAGNRYVAQSSDCSPDSDSQDAADNGPDNCHGGPP